MGDLRGFNRKTWEIMKEIPNHTAIVALGFLALLIEPRAQNGDVFYVLGNNDFVHA